MRKMNMSLKKFKRRHNVFLLCFFALVLLCVLPMDVAKAGADAPTNTYTIENNDIQSVSLQYTADNGNTWHNVGSNHTFNNWEQIGFSMAYTIPANALSYFNDEETKIQYQVTGITKDGKLIASSGDVYDITGYTKVGEYTISDTGLITISLNNDDGKKQIEDNKAGSPIHQTVRFSAQVSELKYSDGGEKEIVIGNIKVTVPVNENQTQGSQLSVSKTAGSIDADGMIKYSIDIYSNNGTGSNDVIITDTMTGGMVPNEASGITVTKGNGETVSDINFSYKSDTSFSLKLPKMDANSHYYITYQGKVDADAVTPGSTAKVTNKAEADSKDEENNVLHGERQIETPVSMISKSGSYNSETGKVTWTIKINSLGKDLEGYKLSDQFYGSDITSATLTNDSNNVSTTITMPYSFPNGSKSNYTITYQTEPTRDVGKSESVNTAKLQPKEPNSNPYEGVGKAWIGTAFEPLSKKADSVKQVYAFSQNLVRVDWTVTIDAKDGDIRPNETTGTWTYTDNLQNQYIKFNPNSETTDTEEAFKQSIKDAFGEYWNDETRIEFIRDGWPPTTITGFTITSKTTIPKGTPPISFSYHSLAPMPANDTKTTYYNHGKLTAGEGTQDVYPGGTYSPLVQKFDARADGNTGTTTHDYYDKALSDDGQSTGAGILKWRIQLHIPDETPEAITLMEQLPKDPTNGVLVDLYESEHTHALTMQTPDNTEHVFKTFGDADQDHHVDNSAQASVTINEKTISATYNQTGGTVQWTIPADLVQQYKGQVLNFYIAAQVKPDVIPGLTKEGYQTKNFENQISVKVGDSEPVLRTQTQTISKDDRYDALEKKYNPINNNLKYTLEINPEGKDYLADSDTLTIVDEFKYSTPSSDASMTLLPESVVLYRVENNGEKTKIDNPVYTLNQTSERDQWNPQYNHTDTIELTVPDNTHLVLEYIYKANGKDNDFFFDINNTASLKGIQTHRQTTHNARPFNISESGASSSADDAEIVIYKYDSSNRNEKLSGATFKLEKYNRTTNQYEQASTKTTGESGQGEGQIKFTEDDGLTFNTAYRLTETKAPRGYIVNSTPYYFYIYNDENKYPKVFPTDFKGTVCYNNSSIDRPNQKMEGDTEITVGKIWMDKNYNWTPPAGGGTVTFDVHQVEKLYAVNAKLFRKEINRTSELDNSFKPLTEGSYAYGTKLKVTITNIGDTSTELKVFDNDEKLPFEKSSDGKTYVLNDYVVQREMNWKIILDSDQPANLNANVEVIQNGQKRFDNIFKKNVTLDATNPYSEKKITDLPLYGTETIDNQATDVAYAYYVKEHPVDGYQTSYYNNDGITSGEIGIINTKLDNNVINVRKEWQKEDGTPETPSQDSISFNLIQKATTIENPTSIKVTTGSNINGNVNVFIGIPDEDFYASGSSLHYKITYHKNYSKPNLTANINGTTKDLSKTTIDDYTTVYEFDTGPLNGDTTISINKNESEWTDSSGFTGEVTVAESGDSSGGMTTVTKWTKPYEISAASNWEWYSSTDSNDPNYVDLKTSELKDINGVKVPVFYEYYVEEVNPPDGFAVSYRVGNQTKTNGADNPIPLGGTGTIINRKNATESALTLPSTGSMGMWIMMAIGLGLMGYGAWRLKKGVGKPDKPNGENTDESG